MNGEVGTRSESCAVCAELDELSGEIMQMLQEVHS